MIFLGKVLKTRGNKGEVVIKPSPGFEQWTPEVGEGVILQSSRYEINKNVQYCKDIRGACVFKFKDVDSINDAYRLIGYSLYSPRMEEPTSGTPGDVSAIDVSNYTVKDINGNLWGQVTYMDTDSANELLEVTSPSGDLIYVPYSGGIVKTVDPEQKLIIIDPPEGLKELNE